MKPSHSKPRGILNSETSYMWRLRRVTPKLWSYALCAMPGKDPLCSQTELRAINTWLVNIDLNEYEYGLQV